MNLQMKFRKFLFNILPYLILALLMFALNTFVDQTKINESMIPEIQAFGLRLVVFLVVVFALGLFVYYLLKRKFSYSAAIYSLIFIGIVVRIIYVLYTDLDTRQYDVGFSYDFGFKDGAREFPWTGYRGHMEYIYTIFSTGKLPVINDLANSYQYYHPPLWHFLAAGWMKLNESTGMNVLQNAQSIQFLSCFCSCSIMIVVYRILQALNVKDKFSLLVMPLVCFLPVFYIMAGCINNDILMILLSCISILYFIRWYRWFKWTDLIVCGVTLGLAMMTKVSAVVLAIPFGLFFIFRFLVNKNENGSVSRIKLFLQYVAFAISSIPIGIWYPIRNFIKYNQPLNYVLRFEETHSLYCGDSSIVERFLSFPKDQITEHIYANSSRDYNIWAYLFKTSMFEEYPFYAGVDKYGRLLFLIALLLGALTFLTMCYMICVSIYNMIKKRSIHSLHSSNVFLGVIWLSVLASYIMFNISYPFGCTMDVRYIIPAVLATMIFLGVFVNYLERRFSSGAASVVSSALSVVVVVFSVCSILFYMNFSWIV